MTQTEEREIRDRLVYLRNAPARSALSVHYRDVRVLLAEVDRLRAEVERLKRQVWDLGGSPEEGRPCHRTSTCD